MNWVVEFDIKGAFDHIDHKLLLKAVRHHVKDDWILLYIERWLKAPFETADGVRVSRESGTPQGGVISPLLMNLFMHYSFDCWMQRTFPGCPFARYADDAVVHCRSEKQACEVMAAIKARLEECLLTIHPEKSKIVYCKDSNRKAVYPTTQFTFLGFTFRPRKAWGNRGRVPLAQAPAVERFKTLSDELDEAIVLSMQELNGLLIKHTRKVYGCRGCESAPVTADKPAQLIEKSMASPSVLAILLTYQVCRRLAVPRFETVLSRHGIEIPRQILSRWIIQCGERLQPLLNLMRDRLLESPVIHCDDTLVQVLKEPDRDPTRQSWRWVQASGSPDRKVVWLDSRSSHAQEVPLRLLESYRGYVMTDDYAGYNALALKPGADRLACRAHTRRKFVEARKVQPKGSLYYWTPSDLIA